MKTPRIVLTGLLVSLPAWGQGTVNFANKITGAVDARVIYSGSMQPAVGGGNTWDTRFVAQLYAAPSGGAMAAVGDPIPFRNSGPGTGYWPGETRTIPGVTEGGVAIVKVVAWSLGRGATYEAARMNFIGGAGGTGESPALTVVTGGGILPPAPLVGLQGFSITLLWPEPSPLALAILGAGILFCRGPRPRAVGARTAGTPASRVSSGPVPWTSR